MKYFTRLNKYQASNVTFNPETQQAHSYGWWRFTDIIGGKLVFNNYYYSPTTCGHQWKIRRLLAELGIEIFLTVECPKGLQSGEAFNSIVDHYKTKINELQAAIDKRGSWKSTNLDRRKDIAACKAKMANAEGLYLTDQVAS